MTKVMFKVKKLSPQEVLQAALGELQIEVDDEMLKAMGIDAEARIAGILTKGVGDSHVDQVLAEIKSAIAASTTAIVASAVPLQMPPEFTAAIEAFNAFRAELTALKNELVAVAEKATQAAVTAEAVRDELGKKIADPGVVGKITPEMTEFITNQANAAKKATSVFAYDSFQ